MSSIIIKGAGHALPPNIVTNKNLELKIREVNNHWENIITNQNGELAELWKQYGSHYTLEKHSNNPERKTNFRNWS